jgi:hypothetical protein
MAKSMKTSLDEKAEFVLCSLSFCKAVFLRNRLLVKVEPSERKPAKLTNEGFSKKLFF